MNKSPSYSRVEQIITWTALVAFIVLVIVIAFIAYGTIEGLVMTAVLAGAIAWLGVTGNLIDRTRERR